MHRGVRNSSVLAGCRGVVALPGILVAHVLDPARHPILNGDAAYLVGRAGNIGLRGVRIGMPA